MGVTLQRKNCIRSAFSPQTLHARTRWPPKRILWDTTILVNSFTHKTLSIDECTVKSFYFETSSWQYSPTPAPLLVVFLHCLIKVPQYFVLHPNPRVRPDFNSGMQHLGRRLQRMTWMCFLCNGSPGCKMCFPT